jgi:hypothetical protein
MLELSKNLDSNNVHEARNYKEFLRKAAPMTPWSSRLVLTSLDGRGVCLNCPLLIQRSILIARLLLDLVHVQVGDLSGLPIEDLGEFLKRWASGLNVEEVDECKFDEDPDL